MTRVSVFWLIACAVAALVTLQACVWLQQSYLTWLISYFALLLVGRTLWSG